MSRSLLTPALFLDRDGIINHEVGFLHRAQDVRFVEGIVPLIRHARQLGYKVVVITNQSGIARGYYTEQDFHTLMDWMRAELARQDAVIDAVYFSPFHPVHGVGQYKQDTDCRKPGPGMLTRAAEEHALDLGRSVLIGDRCSDIAAGAAAGLPLRILLTGTEDEPCPAEIAHHTIATLAEAIPLLPTPESL